MKKLYLEDLSELSENQVKKHICSSYEYTGDLDKYTVLIAYESVGSWGCDSSSWFLLQDKESKELYETSGSHCSCHGFEGQFDLESTSIEYLSRDNFRLSCGGYDNACVPNQRAVKKYIQYLVKALKKEVI